MLLNINTQVIKYKFSFKVTDGFLKIINTSLSRNYYFLANGNDRVLLPTKKTECVYIVDKKMVRRKKNHWNTNEMNLCKLQLNMPHNIYILGQNCAMMAKVSITYRS